MVVDNGTKHDFWFYGYRSNQPVYVLSEWRDSEWHEFPLAWCGTSMGEHRLQAEQVFTFELYAQTLYRIPTGIYRVGLQFRRRRTSDPLTAWSEAIEIVPEGADPITNH